MASITYAEKSNFKNGVAKVKEFELTNKDQWEHDQEVEEWLDGLSETDDEIYTDCVVLCYDDIPFNFISESELDPDYFEFIDAISRSKLSDAEAIFKSGLSIGINVSEIEERYYGSFDSDHDFAFSELNDYISGANVPEVFKTYFDYDRYATDIMSTIYSEVNGHYFREVS